MTAHRFFKGSPTTLRFVTLVAGLHTLCDAKMVNHAVDRGFFDCTNQFVHL